MENPSSKLTAQQLLAELKQVSEDAEVFKELWQGYLCEIPLPPDFEIKSAVRRLSMADLTEGINSYAAVVSQMEGKAKRPTAKNAMNYICGTAWKILEKENPDQEFHPTARRQRNAEKTQ